MEEMSPLFGYEENINELKHKLLHTALELESLKMKANVEVKEHEETVQRLLNLLANAYQERNEARYQLQKLLDNILTASSSRSPDQPSTNSLSHFQSESPLLVAAKANLSITESNSETYNHLSNGSSPVISLFDSVSSLEFSNMNMAGSSNTAFTNHPLAQECNGSMLTGLVSSGMSSVNYDRASAVIDVLTKGKVLPQKGKLLQAVTGSGPLLQTLLITGQLPQWRNPPPFLRPFGNAGTAFTRRSNKAANVNQKPDSTLPSCAILKPSNSTSSNEMHRWPSPSILESMSNFTGGLSCSGLSNGQMLTSYSTGAQNPVAKLPRLI